MAWYCNDDFYFFVTAFYLILAHTLSIKLNIHAVMVHLAVFLRAQFPYFDQKATEIKLIKHDMKNF